MMSVKMAFQIRFKREARATDSAFERSDSKVAHQMNTQVGLQVRSEFTALPAAVPQVSVLIHVLFDWFEVLRRFGMPVFQTPHLKYIDKYVRFVRNNCYFS